MGDAVRIAGIARGAPVTFEFAGRSIPAFAGESIAAALLAARMEASRTTRRRGEGRGYFCGMGVCWECVVNVDGVGPVRGCSFPVSAGLRVRPVPA